MKRLQIYIEPESDEALAVEAAREGVSKAEIIRRLVAEYTGRHDELDPIDALVGCFGGESGDVDEVVYG
ncbi:MAG: CopG family transcriptional regulator [Pseudonocardiaceae bacterium]